MSRVDAIRGRCEWATELIDEVVHKHCSYETYSALIESAHDIPYLLDKLAARDARIAELEGERDAAVADIRYLLRLGDIELRCKCCAKDYDGSCGETIGCRGEWRGAKEG